MKGVISNEGVNMDQTIHSNGITLHYLDHTGGDPAIVLLHGLSANAHCFDGLVTAGLSPRFRLLTPDLRGRGLSDKPETGYGMAAHAADIIGLLDALRLETVIIGGHSFGGLLTLYLAAHYPDRVSKIIIIDAAGSLHPQVRELIKPSLARLGQAVPSWEMYRETMKQMPFFGGYWDADLEAYYRADVRMNADGSVQARSSPAAIAEAVDKALAEPWADYLAQVRQPAILLNALGAFGPSGTPPILPRDQALETVAALPDCRYLEIAGNHMTMLFGPAAHATVSAITTFITADSWHS